MEVGTKLNPGNRYGGHLNQDSVLSCELGASVMLLGVFDGHGLYGEKASETASIAIEEFFKGEQYSWNDLDGGTWSELAKRGFSHAHEEICKVYDTLPHQYKYPLGGARVTSYSPSVSSGVSEHKHQNFVWKWNGGVRPVDFGCTAVVAVCTQACVFLAHVGDSPAFLSNCSEDDGKLSIQQLITAHNTSNKEEIERLSGLERKMSVDEALGAIYLDIPFWRNQHLSVTRSLGHSFLHQYGLSSEPETTVVPLKAGDFSLLLCSDGITDNVSHNIILDGLAEGETSEECAVDIINAALGCPADETDIDNMACIVLRFPE